MMKDSIFALNKAEQRLVIVILLALLAAAIVKHYRTQRSHPVPPTLTSEADTRAPQTSPAEEQREPSDESP